MHFDKEELKKKLKNLSSDIDKGEVTTTAWAWIIAGGIFGLASSCVKFVHKKTKPILSNFDTNKAEEEKWV